MTGFSTPSPYLLELEAKAKQLQDIADAWNKGKAKMFYSDIRKKEIRRNWPELAVLLDGLVNDE